MALTEFGVNHPMAVRLWAKRAMAETSDERAISALGAVSGEADSLLAMLDTALRISRAEAGIHEYIQTTRGWDRSVYRIERSGKQRVPVVYLVTYLPETREFIESGRVFEIHLDAASGRVVGENPLVRAGDTKDIRQ